MDVAPIAIGAGAVTPTQHRRTRRAHRGGVVAPILLLLVGCAGASTFATELEATVRAHEGGSFTLAETGAAGAEVLVVCPYESRESVADRLGFEWGAAPDYSQTGDRQTIAIVEAGQVVSHAELTRQAIDFCSGPTWSVAPLDTALSVIRSPEGVLVVTYS